MRIRFIHQSLIDRKVWAEGEEGELPDLEAKALIHRGVAEPVVREAVSYKVQKARKATKRGRRETRNSDGAE